MKVGAGHLGGLIEACAADGLTAEQSENGGAGDEGPLAGRVLRAEKGETGAVVVEIEIPSGHGHGGG